MRVVFKTIILGLLICGIIPSVYAQSNDKIDFQIWTDITIKNYLNKKFGTIFHGCLNVNPIYY